MPYYLNRYLNGKDALEAYEYFGMEPVLYTAPIYEYSAKVLQNWQSKIIDLGTDSDGNTIWRNEVTTPKGVLVQEGANNCYTGWVTKQFVESERDFEIWNKYVPVPDKVDWAPVIEAKKLIGKGELLEVRFSISVKEAPDKATLDTFRN